MTEKEYIGRRLKLDFIKYVLLRRPLYSAEEISRLLLRTVDSDRIYNTLKEAIPMVCDRHLAMQRLCDENNAVADKLPAWLNPELAGEIVADYRREIARCIGHETFMPALLHRIEKLVWAQGVDDMAVNLQRFLDDLRRHADMYAAMPEPDVAAYDLEGKYRAATRVTLRERITGDNDSDVVAFRSALLGYASDLCRMELYRAMAGIYSTVLGSERLQNLIKALRTAHACAAEELIRLESMAVNQEWESVYRHIVPVDFYERNVEDISGAMAFHMIMFMAFARNERYLAERGWLSPAGELTIFTSPHFDGRDWMNYDFCRLVER